MLGVTPQELWTLLVLSLILKHSAGLAGQQAPESSSHHLPEALRIQAISAQAHPTFLVGCLKSNSGPHAPTTKSLPTEPASWPLVLPSHLYFVRKSSTQSSVPMSRGDAPDGTQQARASKRGRGWAAQVPRSWPAHLACTHAAEQSVPPWSCKGMGSKDLCLDG